MNYSPVGDVPKDITPTLTPTLSDDDNTKSIVTFNGTSSEEQLFLKAVEDRLQFSTDGTHYFEVKDFSLTDTVSITVNLGEGDDRLSIDSSLVDTLINLRPDQPLVFNGGEGTDTLLCGGNADATWNFTDASKGNATAGTGKIQFDQIETIQAGSGSDKFNLGAFKGSILAGAGDDQFIYNGTFEGTIEGGEGSDTLEGADADALWMITGENSGTLETLGFSGVETLQGGSGNDNFKFNSSINFNGSIIGGTGTNTADYSTVTEAIDINLAPFIEITRLLGGQSTSDALYGSNTENLWNITGLNSGDVNTIEFSSFENLVGNSREDTFKFSVGGQLTGMVEGFSQDFAAYTSESQPEAIKIGDRVRLADGNVYEAIVAQTNSSSIDLSLQAQFYETNASQWKLVYTNDSSQWEALKIKGDVVDFSALTAGLTIDSDDGNADYVFPESPGDPLPIMPSNVPIGYRVRLTDDLVYEAVNEIQPTANQTTVDLKNGVQDYASNPNWRRIPVKINQVKQGSTLLTTFNAIETLIGSQGADTIYGTQRDTSWEITGTNAGKVDELQFQSIENLKGSDDYNDWFTFDSSTGKLTGKIDGGAGAGLDGVAIKTPELNSIDPSATRTIVFNNFNTLNPNDEQSGSFKPRDLAVLSDPSTTITYTNLNYQDLGGFTGSWLADRLILEDADSTIDDGILRLRSENLQFYQGNTLKSEFLIGQSTDDLIINMGYGNDTLTIKSLDPLFNRNITIEGGDVASNNLVLSFGSSFNTFDNDTVIIENDLSLSGLDLSITAEKITVKSGVTVSTRAITEANLLAFRNAPASINLETVSSIADSGSISFSGQNIKLESGVRLLSSVEDGSIYAAGDITIEAEQKALADFENFTPLGFGSEKKATVSISDNAKLIGGEIGVFASAFDLSFSELIGASGYVNNFVLGPIFNQLGNFLDLNLPLKILKKAAIADIDIGKSVQILGDGAVTVSAYTDVISEGSTTGKIFSIGYAEAKSHATVDIGTGTNITAGDQVLIKSWGIASSSINAGTDSSVGDFNPANLSLSFGIAKTDIKSTVVLSEDSTVIAGKTANIVALGESNLDSSTSSGLYSTGLAGLAFGIGLSEADIKAEVNGSITANMNPGAVVKLEFDPLRPGAIDTVNNRINLAIALGNQDAIADNTTTPHALQTGDKISYSNRRGNSIGGLADGRDYYVVVDPNNPDYIYLAPTFTKALRAADRLEDGETGQKIASIADVSASGDLVNLALFDGVSTTPVNTALNSKTVNPSTDIQDNVITVSNTGSLEGDTSSNSTLGSTFELGQAVVYRSNGGTPIGGLRDGGIYYVITDTNEKNLKGDYRFVNQQSFRLAETENKARAGIALNLDPTVAAAATTHSFNALHVLDSGLSTGIGVLADLQANHSVTSSSGLTSQNPDLSKYFDSRGFSLPKPKQSWFDRARSKYATVNQQLNTSIGDRLYSKLSESVSEKLTGSSATNTIEQLGGGGKLSIAGALGLLKTDHKVLSIVGDIDDGNGSNFDNAFGSIENQPTTSKAVLKSREDLEVKATITEQMQINAESTNEPQENLDLTDENKKVIARGPDVENAKFAGSAAIIIGLQGNQAKAIVQGGAQLDADRATRVISDVSYPFLTRIDEFAPATGGEVLDQWRNDGTDVVLKYLDGSAGLRSLLNTWARSTAKADDGGISVSGSINALDFDNVSKAIVKSGALINQDAAWRANSKNQSVSVEATNYMQMLNVAGIFSLELPSTATITDPILKGEKNFGDIGVSGSKDQRGGIGGALLLNLLDNTTTALVESGAKIYSGAYGGLNLKAEEALLHFNFAQSGAVGGTFGIGGSVSVFVQNSNTLAQLSSGVIVTGGVDPNEPDLVGSPLTVYAGSLQTNINWTGGVAASENIGFGISVSVNDIRRDTNAVIGNIDPANLNSEDLEIGKAPGTDTSITNMGDINVQAKITGAIWAFSVAAAIVFESDAPDNAQDDTGGGKKSTQSPIPGSNDVNFGLGVSGDVSINTVSDRARAYIHDAGTIEAEAVKIQALNTASVVVASGAAAFVNKNDAPVSVGIAGSVSVNTLKGTTQAYVKGENTTVNKKLKLTANDDVTLDASRSSEIFALTIAGSLVLAKGKKSSLQLAIAGSVSVNQIDENVVESFIQGATVDVLNQSDLTITATDNSSILAIGGAASLAAVGTGKSSAAVAVGASLAFNGITNGKIRAFIDQVTINKGMVNKAGKVTVLADVSSAIRAITVGAAGAAVAGSGGFALAGAGAGSGNQIKNLIEASIRNSSEIYANGSVTVEATDESLISANGGGFALALSLDLSGSKPAVGASIGLSVAYNKVNNQTLSEINRSIVISAGAVSVIAKSAATINAFTLAGSVSGSVAKAGISAAGSGAGSGNFVTSTAQALIHNGSTVKANGGDINLIATDEWLEFSSDDKSLSEINALNAQLNGQPTYLNVAQTEQLFRDNDNDLNGIASVSVIKAGREWIVRGVDRERPDGSIEAGKSYRIVRNPNNGENDPNNENTANDTLSIFKYSDIDLKGSEPTLLFSQPAGNLVDLITSELDSNQAINIGIDQVEELFKDKGITFSGVVSISSIKQDQEWLVKDTLGKTYRVLRNGNRFDVFLTSAIVANAVGISLAGTFTFNSGGAFAVGAVVTKNEIDKTIKAAISDQLIPLNPNTSNTIANQITQVNSIGDINISAESNGLIEGLLIGATISVALSGNAALGLSASLTGAINTIRNTTEALIEGATVEANGDVSLSAIDRSWISTKSIGVAASVAVGNVAVAVGVAAAFAVNDIANTIKASIDDRAEVRTTAGSVLLNATSQSDITALTVAVGVSFSLSDTVSISVAGAGAVSQNTIANTVDATIKNNSVVDGARIALNARDSSAIKAQSIGIAAGLSFSGGVAISVAIGISATINEIRNTTRALIETSDVDSSAGLDLSANSTARITAENTAASISIAGAPVGVAIAGAGAGASNVIDNTTLAAIRGRHDGQNLPVGQSLEDAQSVQAANDINVLATDSAAIQSNVDSVALSGGLVAGALGISVAENAVSNAVRAYIDSATVKASSGNITVDGKSTVNANGESTASSVAIGIGAAGAGAGTYTTIYGKAGTGATGGIAADNVKKGQGNKDTIEGFFDTLNSTELTESLQGGKTLSTSDSDDAKKSAAEKVIKWLEHLDDSDPQTPPVNLGSKIKVATIQKDSLWSIQDENGDLYRLKVTPIRDNEGNVLSYGFELHEMTSRGLINALNNAGSSNGPVEIKLENGSKSQLPDPIDVLKDRLSSFRAGLGLPADSDLVKVSTLQTDRRWLLEYSTGKIYRVQFVPQNPLSLELNAEPKTYDYQVVEITGEAVSAYVDDATVTANQGTVDITATSDFTAKASSGGGAITAGLALGVMVVGADIQGGTRAYVGDGSTLTAAGLSVKADSNQRAEVNSIVASVGLVAGAGAGSYATVGGDVEAYIGQSQQAGSMAPPTTINVLGGAVTVDATSDLTAIADSEGGSGGAVAIAVMVTHANVAAATRAYVGDGTDLKAGSLTIQADAARSAQADSLLVGIGIAAGIGAKTNSAVTGETAAFIGKPLGSSSGQATTIDVSGAVTVDATSEATAIANAEGGAGALAIAIAGLVNNATIDGNTSAYISDSTTVNAGSLIVQANTTKREAKSLSKVVSIALGAGALSETTSTITGETVAFIGAQTGSAAGFSPANLTVSGNIKVSALSSANAVTDTTLGAGGLIAGSDVKSNATVTTNTRAYLGEGTQVLNVNQLDVLAEAANTADARALATGGGGVEVSAAEIKVNVTPTIEAFIGNNVSIAATGNVTVDATSTVAEGDSRIQSSGVGLLLTVRTANSTTNVTPTVTSYVGSGSTIDTDGNVTVNAIAKAEPTVTVSDTFSPTTAVDLNNDTIAFDYNLNVGDVVVYDQNGNADPVGGLTNQRDYSVISNADGKIRLGVSFAGATIDALTDTIHFANNHNLQEGDRLVYNPNGNPIIGGLVSGKTYVIKVIDFQTIKLIDPTQVPTAAKTITPIAVNGENDVITLTGHGFTDGQAVTYRAPETKRFSPFEVDVIETEVEGQAAVQTTTVMGSDGVARNQIVNADNDNIFILNHGFSTGELVTYRVSGGSPMSGLVDNRTYKVQKLSDNALQLRNTVTLDLTLADVEGGKDTITRSSGSWTADGFQSGQTISLSGQLNDANKNKAFTIESVSEDGKVLVLSSSDQLSAEILTNITVDGAIVELASDKTVTPSASVIHSLARPGDLPIAAAGQPDGSLVDGRTYYVLKQDDNTFKLAATPGGIALDLNAAGLSKSANHSFGTEGIDLSAATDDQSGNHLLYFDLTSQHTGEHRLLGAGGVPFAILAPPAGDGRSSATAVSGNGGIIAGASPQSQITVNQNVTAFVAAKLVEAGGDVAIASDAASDFFSNANAGAGGAVAVGVVKTKAVLNNRSNAFVGTRTATGAIDGTGITIDATGNFTLNANLNNKLAVSGYMGGGGLGANADVDASGQIDFASLARVGTNATITSTNALQVTATSSTTASNSAETFVGALGAFADSNYNNDANFPKGIRIGTATNPALTQVEIGQGADLRGGTVDLAALVEKLDVSAKASARAFSPILLGRADAFANAHADIYSNTEVVIQGSALTDETTTITGQNGVDIRARQDNLKVDRLASKIAVALIPPQRAIASGNTVLNTNVTADTGVVVSAGTREAGTDLQARTDIDDIALLVEASQGQLQGTAGKWRGDRAETYDGRRGADTTDSRITWNADVEILAARNPVLKIGADGNIVETTNVTVEKDDQGNFPTAGEAADVDGDGIIEVDDIVNEAAGNIVFEALGAKSRQIVGAVDEDGKPVDPGIFKLSRSFEAVTIVNESNKDLLINNIKVINDKKENQPRIILKTGDQGSEAREDTVKVNFELAPVVSPTAISIQNRNVGDIHINGTIENPIGSTDILNTQGDIVATNLRNISGADNRTSLIQTNRLALEATAGDIGSNATVLTDRTAERLNVDLVQSQDRPIQVEAIAAQNLELDILGRLRDNTVTDFEIPIHLLQAGNNVDVWLRNSVAETTLSAAGGVSVEVPSEKIESEDVWKSPFYKFFRPDTGNENDALGAFANSAQAQIINSTYRFESEVSAAPGIIAGGNISITHPNTNAQDTVVNVAGFTDVLNTGYIDVATDGFVTLTESAGDLRVDTITSTEDDVMLIAQAGGIVDALNDGASKVNGQSINLTASLGGIGMATNALDIDSQVKLTATARDDIFIIETEGNLNVDQVTSIESNVTLTSASGSILDYNNTPDSDVAAAFDITLSATGAIGTVNNDLDIDSSRTGDGKLSAIAQTGIYITETADALNVQQAKTANGDIRLTVPDRETAGQDLNLLENGMISADQGKVDLLVGDNVTTHGTSQSFALTTLTLRGDYNSQDAVGTVMSLGGTLEANRILITSNTSDTDFSTDQDEITFKQTWLKGATLATTGGGEDTFLSDRLQSMSLNYALTLDGEGDADAYQINISGGTTGNLINIFDTGSTGEDTVDLFGTEAVDNFLLRASQNEFPTIVDTDLLWAASQRNFAGGVAFVAALNGEIAEQIERVNYNKSLEFLRVNAAGGDDNITLDDNWTKTEVIGGAGVDQFQVGQMFKTERDASVGVADFDIFETTGTTRGYLSNGISYETVLRGGGDDDQFTVFRNTAKLDLFGENGDDLFTIRSFATQGSRTIVNPVTGATEDIFEYVDNAEVNVDGGPGNDILKVIFTEFADTFLITRDAIIGGGRVINYTNIETVNLDGAEGDDRFYVLSTHEDVITKLTGGLGNDAFSIVGDVPAGIDPGMPTRLPVGFEIVDGKLIAKSGSHQLNHTQGELIVDGFGGAGSAGGLGEPVILPAETNLLSSTGKVLTYSGSGQALEIDTMVVNTADLWNFIQNETDNSIANQSGMLPNLQPTTLAELLFWTVEISRGEGLGRFWQIVGVEVNGDQTTLRLKNPGIPAPEWGMADSNGEFAITNLSPNFFVDERTTQDRVMFFNDATTEANTGNLTSDRLTGLGMGSEGIQYNNFETVEALLGSGDDSFTVEGTADGSITAVHGGGGSDTITVSDRGDTDDRGMDADGTPIALNASLIIYGDTSQDGGPYTGSTDQIAPGIAYAFTSPGNDAIDASTSEKSVVIYGGAGNDTIKGSQADDQLAGGSGDDTISGEAGTDHIYGDSGFNVDLASRELTAPTTNNSPALAADSLVVGADQLDGGSGDDIILGDHGIITQAEGTPRLESTGDVTAIETAGSSGLADTITGGPGNDRILGGNGDDTIRDLDGDNIVIGDHGQIRYDGADNNPATPDLVQSTVPEAGGGKDAITTGTGNDIIIGGLNQDAIDAGSANNVVLGDNGSVQLFNGQLTQVESSEPGQGEADTISTGDGNNMIIAGDAPDTVDTGNGTNVIVGDSGRITYAPETGSPTRVETIAPSVGGTDTITTGNGTNTVLGGADGDTIQVGGGQAIVIGDNGFIDYTAADSDPTDIDFISSTDVIEGGDDTITTAATSTIIIGGTGSDTINAGNSAGQSSNAPVSNNIVIGDNGVIQSAAASGSADLAAPFDGHPITLGQITTIAPEVGGDDTIATGTGRDIVIGGAGNDTIFASGSRDGITPDATAAAQDGNNLVLGDNGLVDYVAQDNDPTDIDRVWSTDTAIGGDDAIWAGAGNDIVLGGKGDDAIAAGRGQNIVMGDSGEITAATYDAPNPAHSAHPFTIGTIVTTGFADGGNDTVTGSDENEVIIGGSGDDVIDAGAGNDVVLGDQGKIDAGNDPTQPFSFDRLPLNCDDPMQITALPSQIGEFGNDTIYGGEGDDLLMGQEGSDLIYGGAGNDDIIGGSNVAGALDTGDRLDGGTGNDVIAGDNAHICRDGDLSPRIRTLTGTELYGETPGVNDAEPLVGNTWNAIPTGDPVRKVTLLNHASDTDASLYGDDYIAGNADDDHIYGQLGNDTIQGDGDIEQAVGANRLPNGELSVASSVERATDGDDYIEGNGGEDVIFGNLGQDDIIGGSSSLYGLTTANQRPDGSDLIFGGAGTDIDRNHAGDMAANGHALDADMILGDNGNIYRIVGTNGVSTGEYLGFNYDRLDPTRQMTNITGQDFSDRWIVARTSQLLDYTPGGIDVNPNAAQDIGAADEIHGESGDDFVYGMVGNDVLFGEGQNDDLIGGTGNDWISGGTGEDGVIGDDGRIYTSRNGTAEPLYGIAATTQEEISTPGKIQQATINVTGALKKSVNLTPFSTDPNWNGTNDEFEAGATATHRSDDIIFGGLGNDFLHGGSGDDAISGAEALSEAYIQDYDEQGNLIGIVRSDYLRPYNPGDVLAYNPIDLDGRQQRDRAGEFALYDEYDPRRKILLDADGNLWKSADQGIAYEWTLNFNEDEGNLRPGGTVPKAAGQQTETYSEVYDDGNDVIFGALGNDWLVGGTGRDNLYGGWGNDLLNADDDHTTNDDLNDQPDTHPTYEDRAFGGAGRDVLIGNTGGDRLVDWVGEFNSYLVPFAPFGMATVSRTLQPQLAEFLYALSQSDGADATRAADTGGDAIRNGEPFGELGLVLQKDFAWRDQTGAPSDPQAGNIPGGKRDILRTANFNDSTSQGFAADSGTWTIAQGRLQVEPTTLGGDAVSVFYVDAYIPNYFEMQATIRAVKPTAGYKANSYLIFDYQSKTDFKFAGIDLSTNKLVIGHRTATAWNVSVQSNMLLKADTDYNLFLALNGNTATLVINNQTTLSHTFPIRIDSLGIAHGLNSGMVGIGADNARAAIDNVTVQRLAPTMTTSKTLDFSAGPTSLFQPTPSGQWQSTLEGRYVATAIVAEPAIALVDQQVAPSSILELSTILQTSTDGQGGFIFDRYSETDYKFVTLSAETGQILVGHSTAEAGTVIDAAYDALIAADTDYRLGLTLQGNTISVTLNDQLVFSYSFNALITDGAFGLMSLLGTVSFDLFSVSSNDPNLTL